MLPHSTSEILYILALLATHSPNSDCPTGSVSPIYHRLLFVDWPTAQFGLALGPCSALSPTSTPLFKATEVGDMQNKVYRESLG